MQTRGQPKIRMYIGLESLLVSVFACAVRRLPVRGVLSRQECELPSYPPVTSDTWGAVNPKTASHLFSQVLGCHTGLHALTLTVQAGPPTLKTVVSVLLIFMTSPNHTAQKMKGGGRSARGSRRGLPWLGGLGWSSLCFTSCCAPSTLMAPGQ